MIGVQIEIPKNLKDLSETKTYRDLSYVGAFKVYDSLRKHFALKNAKEPNKLGAKRTNFWTQIRSSVRPPVWKGDDLFIAITDFRFAQKLYGGMIRAKRVKFLTIPISKQAYDKRVSVFEQETGKRLFRIKSKKGNFLLAENLDGEMKPHYLLKEVVNQKPNKNALPTDEEIMEAFSEGVYEELETIAAQE